MKNNNMFGVMIDCSRNAVMSVDGLKRFVDKLSIMGYNTLMLYTEDTLQVEDEPLFGYMRGRYTYEEIQSIDAYCREKGIELIPCIQTLAHLNQMFQWYVYADVNDYNDILLVDEEKTYQLIENIIRTCSKNFTSKKIHIGFDEAFMLGLGRYKSLHGIVDKLELVSRHLNRVLKIVEKYNLEPMMWSDMFFRALYNGSYYGTGKIFPESIKRMVPQNVKLFYWDYYHDEQNDYEDLIMQHQSISSNIAFAGGAWKWMGFPSDNKVSIKRLNAAMLACEKCGVRDVLITCWGDHGAECPVNAVLPSLFYASELRKGISDLKLIKQHFFEIFHESFDDFLLFDMEKLSNGSKAMLFNDCFSGKFDCTVKGNGEESRFYGVLKDKFKKAEKNSPNFKYMFNAYKNLCEVLEVKYDLGYQTKTLYQERNMDGLRELLPKYDRTINLLKKFLGSFENMWFYDNKPHGFDVQDIRIGGVIQRLKSCKNRLKNYVIGKIDQIPELEEPIINCVPEADKKEMPFNNNFANAVTVNVLS